MAGMELEDPEAGLLVLRDAVELRLAAAGIFSSEIEGLLTEHPDGPRASLMVRVGEPFPSEVRMQELAQELGEMFTEAKIEIVADKTVGRAPRS